MENYLRRFRLYGEKEQPELVYDTISKAVPFEGTNLWILIFAIFIASLGLNVSSTAVVIGAMLISPLMGPIMGIGYSLSINDLPLLKKSLKNYAFAGLVGLVASMVYFLLSPIHEASPEIISRTKPNLYDVLIAFFGGLAGILAACSKQKGNVIPGVAIATALMPPLCTAGYGLAMMNMTYFLGAMYLYLINTVFITVATYITVRYLNYPYRQFPDESAKKKSQRIITFITLITILPSIYLAYDIIKKNRFTATAKEFVKNESKIDGNLLFDDQIDDQKEAIELFYLGEPISDSTKKILKRRLTTVYKLDSSKLTINLGLAASEKKQDEDALNDKMVTVDKIEFQKLQFHIDSMQRADKVNDRVYTELKALYPNLTSAFIQNANRYTDSVTENNVHLAFLTFDGRLRKEDKERITRFLDAGFEEENFEVIFR